MPHKKQSKIFDAKIILGIDPGVATTGFGVIKKTGGCLQVVDFGCIKTKPQTSFSKRLEEIHQQLKKLIRKYQPSIISVEDLFFCKNVKTALAVGQARGVVLLTAMQSKLPIYEYTPLQVKQAITSYGRADKLQIQNMVKVILKLTELPKPDDAADALAIAICCANSLNLMRF